MTEIRELRVGNWVELSGDHHHIDTIQETYSVSQVHLEGNLLYNDSAIINPIPFTTEWAERFHLIGSVINGFCIAPSEHKGHDYDLCLYDEHTWDSERTILCPINSVHHCQNLFLDLANHILE